MDSKTAIVTAFKNATLNTIGGELIENYKGFHANQQLAKEYLGKAIVRRFLSGKILSENHDLIIEECGSQRAFGEQIGVTEGMLSNDKRGYEALASEGADTPEKMLSLLTERKIKPNVFEWERMPAMLNEPEKFREPDRRSKDEKRLESLYSEIDEIKTRNEGAHPEVAERAEDTLKYLEGVEQHLGAQDVFKSTWRSRDYLDFVKSIGFDYITGQQAEYLDPHHTLPDGSSRGPDGKVADVFVLPVNRATHNAIEEGQLKPTRLQICEALIRTMALFIVTHMKSD